MRISIKAFRRIGVVGGLSCAVLFLLWICLWLGGVDIFIINDHSPSNMSLSLQTETRLIATWKGGGTLPHLFIDNFTTDPGSEVMLNATCHTASGRRSNYIDSLLPAFGYLIYLDVKGCDRVKIVRLG